MSYFIKSQDRVEQYEQQSIYEEQLIDINEELEIHNQGQNQDYIKLLYLCQLEELNQKEAEKKEDQYYEKQAVLRYQNQIKKKRKQNSEECIQIVSYQEGDEEQNQKKKKRKETQIKLCHLDNSKILVTFIQNIKGVQGFAIYAKEFIKHCQTALQQRNKTIEEEYQKNRKYYEKQLENFTKRNFTKTVKIMRQNIFNILFKLLWIQNKDKEKIKQLLIDCFIEKKLKWFDLLDLSKKKIENIQKMLYQIREIIKEEQFLQKNYQYLSDIKYLKYDFIELANNLTQIYYGLLIYVVNQNYGPIIENVFQVLKSICQMKEERKYQKLQINFTKKNINDLINQGAKVEIIVVIKMGFEDCTSWLDQKQQVGIEEKQIYQIILELQQQFNLQV